MDAQKVNNIYLRLFGLTPKASEQRIVLGLFRSLEKSELAYAPVGVCHIVANLENDMITFQSG
jgi:hypothetical protein